MVEGREGAPRGGSREEDGGRRGAAVADDGELVLVKKARRHLLSGGSSLVGEPVGKFGEGTNLPPPLIPRNEPSKRSSSFVETSGVRKRSGEADKTHCSCGPCLRRQTLGRGRRRGLKGRCGSAKTATKVVGIQMSRDGQAICRRCCTPLKGSRSRDSKRRRASSRWLQAVPAGEREVSGFLRACGTSIAVSICSWHLQEPLLSNSWPSAGERVSAEPLYAPQTAPGHIC